MGEGIDEAGEVEVSHVDITDRKAIEDTLYASEHDR